MNALINFNELESFNNKRVLLFTGFLCQLLHNCKSWKIWALVILRNSITVVVSLKNDGKQWAHK